MSKINAANEAINNYIQHHGVPPAEIRVTAVYLDELVSEFEALSGKRYTRTDVRYRGIPFVVVAPVE